MVQTIDLLIVGAGPVGLSAAIYAKRMGINYLVVERGVLTNSIYKFPENMTFFTTADLLEIGGHPFPSTLTKPTRQIALDYYRLIAQRESLDIRLNTEVIDIIDNSANEFTIVLNQRRFGKIVEKRLQSRFIILATGYFDTPRGLGGIPGEFGDNTSHYFTSPHPFFKNKVTIIGAGNSGAEAALELYRYGAEVTVLHNHPEVKATIKYWVAPDLLNRIAEGSINAIMSARVTKIDNQYVYFEKDGKEDKVESDFTFILTGFRPNLGLLKNFSLDTDDETGRVNLTECFESNIDGLFLVGSVGFGKFTNSIFIENGREHAGIAVREIASRINDSSYQPNKKPLDLAIVPTNK